MEQTKNKKNNKRVRQHDEICCTLITNYNDNNTIKKKKKNMDAAEKTTSAEKTTTDTFGDTMNVSLPWIIRPNVWLRYKWDTKTITHALKSVENRWLWMSVALNGGNIPPSACKLQSLNTPAKYSSKNVPVMRILEYNKSLIESYMNEKSLTYLKTIPKVQVPIPTLLIPILDFQRCVVPNLQKLKYDRDIKTYVHEGDLLTFFDMHWIAINSHENDKFIELRHVHHEAPDITHVPHDMVKLKDGAIVFMLMESLLLTSTSPTS